MSYGWKAWDSGVSTSVDDQHHAHRRRGAHVPSASAQEALWTASKRIGTSYRFLKLDLEILAALPQHEVVAAIAMALQSLGRALLPQFGTSPLGPLLAARTEVQELVSLLGSIATRVDDTCAPTDSAPLVPHVAKPNCEGGSGYSFSSSRRPPRLASKGRAPLAPVGVVPNCEASTDCDDLIRVADVVVQSFPADISVNEVGCEAVANEIVRETERTRPESAFRFEFQARVDAHKTRYPGGTLPSELRDFGTYFWERKKWLDKEALQALRCAFCGQCV